MQHVNVEQLLESATRRDRLLRWAELVRHHPSRLEIYHHLEHWTPKRMAELKPVDHGMSALLLAVTDPIFQSQGLARDSSFQQLIDFFSLTQEQLHEFSCGCGGVIDRRTMADRIAAMA